MKRFLPGATLLLLLGLVVLTGGERFRRIWERYLVVSVPLEKADALIVLGGEPLARPREAARLYKQGVSGRIFVTGVGDCLRNRQILLAEGVPSGAIVLESKATTTHANALLLKPILEASHVHSALIVTSPFHTRRALATFRKAMPDIVFGVTDASIGWWNRPEGIGDINRFAFLEFLKIAEYRLIYGVSPRLDTPAR